MRKVVLWCWRGEWWVLWGVQPVWHKDPFPIAHSHFKWNWNKLQGQPTVVIQQISLFFSFYNDRYFGWILWVWSWGVPGLLGLADHRGPDTRVLHQGQDRGFSLPTSTVQSATNNQAWMQRQTGSGMVLAPISCHKSLLPWVKSAQNPTGDSQLSMSNNGFLSVLHLNEYVIQYPANNRSVLKMRDH